MNEPLDDKLAYLQKELSKSVDYLAATRRAHEDNMGVGQSFESCINQYIKIAERMYACTLDQRDAEKLIKMLREFNCNLICKFIKGQKEHGGSLSDRDLKKEIRNEVMDLVVYTHWE